ncbi:MAG: prepilin peptidase [Deltaproteobacteria bacterium]|nr:prepilin peptidase [Deltaproteobacteria bacterium]
MVGSFLNVVIARLPAGESIVSPRSHCPKCRSQIAWYDNIPVLSWLILRGRCRSCKATISPRYPLIELLACALMTALFLRLGVTWQFAFWAPLSMVFLAIVFLDIDHYWIPDLLSIPAMIWALLGAFLPDRIGIIAALIGLLPALALFLIAKIFSAMMHREGMGLGDVKLLAVIGLALGVFPTILVVLFASLQGTIIGLIIIALGGHKPKEPAADGWTPHARAIPFGPFLILAALEILLLPEYFLQLPIKLLKL